MGKSKNRKNRRAASVLSLIGNKTEKPSEELKVKQEDKVKKKNSRSYKRNRGKGGTKPMSYYLPDEIISLLNVKAAREGRTKSELVLEGLEYVLREEIKEAREQKK